MHWHSPSAWVVSITSPSQATDTPQCRRPHHVTSRHTRDARALPTDVWPLRVLLVCTHATRAAAAACVLMRARGLSAAAERRSSVARRNPLITLPLVGPARPRPRAWEPKEDGRSPESPSRSIARGRNGLGRGLGSSRGLPCHSGDLACLPRRRHTLPPGCVPPRHLQHRPTAGATVANSQALGRPQSVGRPFVRGSSPGARVSRTRTCPSLPPGDAGGHPRGLVYWPSPSLPHPRPPPRPPPQ